MAVQTMLVIVAAMLALLTASPALAQPASPCHADDIGVTVCPSGKSELRAINGTPSPRKRYTIAWITKEGETGKDYELFPGPPPTRYAGGDSETFLVRLTDGASLIKLKGEHPGDRSRYNHQTLRAVWSPDENWFVAINESKWSTDVADAYRIGPNGVSEPLDLRPRCEAAERQAFKAMGRRVQLDRFQQWVDVKSIRNDGTMTALCYMQIMKQDEGYQFLVRMKLQASDKTVSAKLGPIKRCRELEGPCAVTEPPD